MQSEESLIDDAMNLDCSSSTLAKVMHLHMRARQLFGVIRGSYSAAVAGLGTVGVLVAVETGLSPPLGTCPRSTKGLSISCSPEILTFGQSLGNELGGVKAYMR